MHALLCGVDRVVTEVTSKVALWLVGHGKCAPLGVETYALRKTHRGVGVETKMMRKRWQG
jgi:hypothetical protein